MTGRGARGKAPAGKGRAFLTTAGGLVLFWIVVNVIAVPVFMASFLRVPGGLLSWAALCSIGAALAGLFWTMRSWAGPQKPDAAAKQDVAAGTQELRFVLALAALTGGLQLLVAPEQLLFLWDPFPGMYLGVQVLGAALAVGAVVWLVRTLPGWLRRRRDPGRVTPGRGTGTVVDQLRHGAVHRAEDIGWPLLLAGVSLVGLLVFGLWSGWAFWEGWVALILLWGLLAERPIVAWQGESARTVLRDARRPEGYDRFVAWRGLAAVWMTLVTASFSVWTGGIRPVPWLAYAVLALVVTAANRAPARLVKGREDAVFARWLDAVPGRRAELETWRAETGDARKTPFGELPAPRTPPIRGRR